MERKCRIEYGLWRSMHLIFPEKFSVIFSHSRCGWNANYLFPFAWVVSFMASIGNNIHTHTHILYSMCVCKCKLFCVRKIEMKHLRESSRRHFWNTNGQQKKNLDSPCLECTDENRRHSKLITIKYIIINSFSHGNWIAGIISTNTRMRDCGIESMVVRREREVAEGGGRVRGEYTKHNW